MSDTTPSTDTTDEQAPDGLTRISPVVIRESLLRVAVAVLAIVAIGATIGFYTSTVAAINEWVAPAFRPLFRAAFNLVIILTAAVGISLILRELSD